MSRFLSHEQTKADLTEYLAEKTLDYNKDSSKLVITSAAGHTRSNKDVGSFPDKQPRGSRHRDDMLRSVCNRAKLKECRNDILFS